MSSSRPLAWSAAGLVAVLALAACTATPAPIVPPSAVPSATAAVATALSSSPSSVPSAFATVDPSAEPVPTDSSQPTNPPDPTPTPRGTPIPGCGIGMAALLADLREIPASLHFGGATIEFRTASVGMRDGSYVADTTIPAGIGLSPSEIAVVVGPGAGIVLRGAGLILIRVDAQVVPWSTVIFSGDLGGSSATPVDLPWRLRSDGSISVSAPMAPGDYMVSFHPLWRSACLEGDGSAYSRIKVL